MGSMKGAPKPVTIRLPPDIHLRLKEIRKKSGAPIQHSVLVALRAYLQMPEESEPVDKKKRGA